MQVVLLAFSKYSIHCIAWEYTFLVKFLFDSAFQNTSSVSRSLIIKGKQGFKGSTLLKDLKKKKSYTEIWKDTRENP